MNTTMTNQSKQRVEKAINIVLREVKAAAIEECSDVVRAQVMMYENLLESTEAWAIYMASKGERCLKLIETRRKLTNKKKMLLTLFEKFSELKWQK